MSFFSVQHRILAFCSRKERVVICPGASGSNGRMGRCLRRVHSKGVKLFRSLCRSTSQARLKGSSSLSALVRSAEISSCITVTLSVRLILRKNKK